MLATNTSAQTVKVKFLPDQRKSISSDLFGIFFEDLNYAADGGLYAELIQNRSFEYSPADHPDWNFLTGWKVVQNNAECSISLGTQLPIHPNNPHYIVLNSESNDGKIGLCNRGFGGIVVREGEAYDISLFARVVSGSISPLIARLESRTGEVLSEITLPKPENRWQQYRVTLQASCGDNHARFVLLFSGEGSIALDMLSLLPQKTFKSRPNGLWADLAQAIADLKPQFVRFPGGCLVHGDGLDNMYRWKDTIGPIETRREQPNIWNYHQSVGLEYGAPPGNC